jgi:hypothetical protein
MAGGRNAVRKGGARPKAEGGLDKVLFVRANQDLLDRLEAMRARQSDATKITLSTADVARAILLAAIERDEKESE